MKHRIEYHKRYRMTLPLTARLSRIPMLRDIDMQPWHPNLLQLHADAKYLTFRDDFDSVIFPSLGSRAGCENLMQAITKRPGFCPLATWLASKDGQALGTIQGVIDQHGHGAIQNLGVVPEARGRGVGRGLLLRALHGFRTARLFRAYLEVTAKNDAAIALYRSVGFRCERTLYKAVEYPPQPKPTRKLKLTLLEGS